MNQSIEKPLRQLTTDIFKLISNNLTNSFISSFGGSNANDLIKIKITKNDHIG